MSDDFKRMASEMFKAGEGAKGSDGSQQTNPTPAPAAQNASPGTTPDAPAADSAVSRSKEDEGQYKAMKAEREKRQAVELEVAQLKGMLAVLQAQKPQTPSESQENDDEFWADPKGYAKRTAEQAVEAYDKALWERTRSWSVNDASTKHDDYFTVAADFEKLVQNPQYAYLVEETRRHPHPAEFAYQTMKQIASPKTDVEKLKAELEAKIRAEYEAKLNLTETNNAPRARDSLAGHNSPPSTQPPVNTKPWGDVMKRVNAW